MGGCTCGTRLPHMNFMISEGQIETHFYSLQVQSLSSCAGASYILFSSLGNVSVPWWLCFHPSVGRLAALHSNRMRKMGCLERLALVDVSNLLIACWVAAHCGREPT